MLTEEGLARAEKLSGELFGKNCINASLAPFLFTYYNFGRIHKTLRVTPAMEAGVTDHVWSLEEIADLAY